MTADTLLSKLDGVRSTGAGRWIAKCPAHGDRQASLSVRLLDDGRVLCHCFASCPIADVLTAVGLTIGDLFPKPAGGYRGKRERDPFNPRDVLFALADETQLAAIVAARIASGFSVSWAEVDRLILAAGRIASAADVFRPHPSKNRRTSVPRGELDEVAHAA